MGRGTEVATIEGVRTPLTFMGSGPMVVVVHGGPGFDRGYVEAPLQSLTGRRTLVFFDQPGVGASDTDRPVTAELTFRHFAGVLKHVAGGQPVGIVAHSWGCLLPLGAARLGLISTPFAEGLLSNPVPPSRARYDAASANLFGRIPPEVQGQYMELAMRQANREIVALLVPYYLSPGHQSVPGLRISIAVFQAVTASLGDFDFSAELPLFRNCHALTSGHDITTPELIGDMLAVVAGRSDIPDAGHFPASETPGPFQSVLEHVFPASHAS